MKSRSKQMRCSLVLLPWLATLDPSGADAQLTVAGNNRLFQSELGGVSEDGDQFGWALASGDFNGDGHDDLAVGTPGKAVAGFLSAGAVYVAYGGPGGLGTGPIPNRVLHQDAGGVAEVAEAGDRFGATLASGDVNGDGYADLAVSSPTEGLSGFSSAGAVHLFLGGPGGVVPAGSGHLLSGATFGDGSLLESDSQFGAALVMCDRNADGRADLVIGIPAPGVESRHGALLEVFGIATGVATTGAVYRQANPSDPGNEFGAALACGRLDGSPGADLFVGAPEAFDANDQNRVGGVWTLSSSGVSALVRRGESPGDRMGAAVLVGRLFSTAIDGYLWSSPNDDYFQVPNSGRAETTGFLIRQGGGGLGDEFEHSDQFGQVLAAGDFNRDGYDEAVFGTPLEDLPGSTPGATIWDGGLVQLKTGPLVGTIPAQPFSAAFAWGDGSQLGFAGLPDDHFASALAVGDFNKDGIEDLAIGAAGAEWNGAESTGIVQILLGSQPNWIFGDGFETGRTWKWSASAP